MSAKDKDMPTISPGEFALVSPQNPPDTRRKVIYEKAKISFAKTTREFFVYLQVTDLKNPKKSDADAIDLDEDLEDNSFLLNSNLKLGYYQNTKGEVVITWKNIAKNGERFEFVYTGDSSPENFDEFDRVACESLYGQKFGSLKDADQSVLDSLTNNYDEADIDKHFAEEDGPKMYPITEGEVIVSKKAVVMVFRRDLGSFVPWKDETDADCVIVDLGKYNYVLEPRQNGKSFFTVPIDSEFNPYFDIPQNALIFNSKIPGSDIICSFLLHFGDDVSMREFQQDISIAIYQNKNKKKIESVSKDDKDYLISAMMQLNVMNDDDNAEYDQPEEESEESEDDVDEYGELDETDEADFSKDINSALEVGHTKDRSFVVRGNKIGVFQNTDRSMKYSTTIRGIDFDPSKILLHEQDSALVLQSSSNSKSLYRMDLETGKIVDEWKTGKEVADFNPVSKFAQTTGETNLYGVSDTSIFRIDPRVNGGMVTPKNSHTYKTKNMGLSNIVTTEQGWMVVGNSKGEIRLFDKLGKNATTSIPGLGDPILGLDVSSDGKLVLVTCSRYLLLLKTSDMHNNGFLNKWKLDERPMPIKLEISPENIVYMSQAKQKLKFTPAKFNISPTSKETTIVTSTGPYLVTWSLTDILKGNTDSYKIKLYDSKITANNFKFGTDQRVILALEDNVNMVSKSSLKKPSDIFKVRKSG